MHAHDFFVSLGDYYFKMATDKGFTGILPAVKQCFTVACQNLKNIISVLPDKNGELLPKLMKTLEFAEMIKSKIDSDPIKYDIQQKFFSNYSEHE